MTDSTGHRPEIGRRLAGGGAGSGAPSPILGLDPGRGGGAALLTPDARAIIATWHWHWLEARGGRYHLQSWLRTYPDGTVAHTEEPTLHRVATSIALDLHALDPNPCALVVEGLFVPREAGVQSVIVLAEAAGEMIGPIRAWCGHLIGRPMASQWRPVVLGRYPKHAKAAEARAVMEARKRWGEVPLLDVGAVAEAACMAAWGWGQRYADAVMRRTA